MNTYIYIQYLNNFMYMYINECSIVWAKRITTCMNTHMYIYDMFYLSTFFFLTYIYNNTCQYQLLILSFTEKQLDSSVHNKRISQSSIFSDNLLNLSLILCLFVSRSLDVLTQLVKLDITDICQNINFAVLYTLNSVKSAHCVSQKMSVMNQSTKT